MKKLLLPLLLLTAACTAGQPSPSPRAEGPDSLYRGNAPAWQSAAEAIAACPEKASGCYSLYDFGTPAPTPAPQGYKLVYLSHYGRHGARYLERDSQYLVSLNVMDAAHEAGKLTPFGEDLYRRLHENYDFCRYRGADLSHLGWEEHAEIARRAWKEYGDLFDAHPEILAKSTLYPRCIMSMSSFCLSLKGCDGSLDIFEDVSERFLQEINPHAGGQNIPAPPRRVSSRQWGGPWGETLEDFGDRVIPYRQIEGRIFSDPSFIPSHPDYKHFVINLHRAACGAPCCESPVDFSDVFTPEERFALWQYTNYNNFLYTHFNMFIDKPLLRNILAEMSADLARDGRPRVRLRFGHDSLVLHILVAMDADGFGRIPASQEELEVYFRNWRVPKAATLLWGFWRNDAGDTLVKMTLNGVDLSLPIEAVEGPYYRFEDFRAHVLHRLDWMEEHNFLAPDGTFTQVKR